MANERLDRILWAELDERPRRPRPPTRSAGAVWNYADLGRAVATGIDVEHAWSEFLHAFFAYKDEIAFTEPPPSGLGPCWCALLAGTAEFLSLRYGLSMPDWVEQARFYLEGRWELFAFDSTWVPWPFPDEEGERRWEATPEPFRKRGLCFEARNLITI